jgi:putative Mg2+ transporter-C (MgtC) family protein
MNMVNRENLGLKKLFSEDIQDSIQVRVKAYLYSSKPNDLIIEQIINRLSLETGITSVGWQTVESDFDDETP